MREDPSTVITLADPPRQDSIPCTRHYRACAASAHDMRVDLHATLATWGLNDLCDLAELLATELFANALRHGRPLEHDLVDVSATVLHEDGKGHLRVAVTDAAADRAAYVQVRDASPGDEGGRGLSMVEMLAERWGVAVQAASKAVWFELATA